MDTVLNQEIVQEIEELTDDGRFYEALDVMQDYVEDGVEQGRFSRARAESDLTLALWIAYADLNIDEYESYLQAVRWLERVREQAFGCGVWYYRLASALLYTGQLEAALEVTEQGVEIAPDYVWGWLNAAMLRAHFGDRQGALQAVEQGLLLEPGDYEFTRTRTEIEAGASLEQMESHYISEQDDLQLAGDPELQAQKRLSVMCMVCDKENLERVKTALGAQEWQFEPPYCYCEVPGADGPVSVRFEMNEAGVSKFDPVWIERLAKMLDQLNGQAKAIVAQRHPGARLELGHLVLERSGQFNLGYHVGKSREERTYAYIRFGHAFTPMPPLTYQDYSEPEDRDYDQYEGSGEDWEMGEEQREWTELELYTESELTALERYIEKTFGRFESVIHELESPDIHVDIYVIAPTKKKNYYTLVTCGMGAHRMDLPPDFAGQGLERAELLVRLPADWQLNSGDETWYWPLRWLKLLARLPLEQETWLGWGHTVPNGRPFAANTQLTGVLLTTPEGLTGPQAVCPVPGGQVVFYEILPLYDEEMDFKLEHGAQELLGRMAQKGALACPWLRLDRPNACANETPDPPVDPAFLRQLAAWHDSEDYPRIVAAIEAVPPEQRGYVLVGQLARALNNMEQYERAIKLLMATKKRGRSDPLWHFRLGYAYYYTDQETKALAEFIRADELAPGDEDTETFIRWCRSAIALPVSVKPFKARVAEFWQAFARQEAELREVWIRQGPDAAAKLVAPLLKLAFCSMPFSLAMTGQEKHCIILSTEGRGHRLYKLLRWRGAAPAELAENWQFRVESPRGEQEPESVPENPEKRLEYYQSYRRNPAAPQDWLLRQDVVAGSTSCCELVRAYDQNDDSIMDEEQADGVICGFLFYTADALPKNQWVSFRGQLEAELARQSEGVGQVLGGAVGFQYSYIDCIAYDLKEFLNLASDLLNRWPLAEIGFHVFRMECGGVNLKATGPQNGKE